MRRAALLFAAAVSSQACAAEPLRSFNGRLFIEARVNGIATEALLDSAAEATLVDPSFAARAKLPKGMPQQIRGSGGTANARLVEGVTIEALGVTVHPEAVVVTDLSDLSRRLIKRPTMVVLGRELFDAARLRIDIGRGRIEAVAESATPPGQRLPLTEDHGVESIPVTVSGTAARAEFDLGNGSDVLISRALANKLGLKVTGHKLGGGVGGQVRRDLVRLERLELAGRELRNITAAIDDQPTAGDLNIGTSILKDFVITTDFKQRAIWLSRR